MSQKSFAFFSISTAILCAIFVEPPPPKSRQAAAPRTPAPTLVDEASKTYQAQPLRPFTKTGPRGRPQLVGDTMAAAPTR